MTDPESSPQKMLPFPELKVGLEDLDNAPESLEDYWSSVVNLDAHEQVETPIIALTSRPYHRRGTFAL